jgi:hypothetical protein
MGISRVFRDRSIFELSEWALHRSFGLSTASLRALPDFIIIGAQRCGTTSLYKYICQHPDVYPSFPKEVHYFSNNFNKGTQWYRSHFPFIWHKKKVENAKKKFFTGEATPYYLSHPHAARRASQVVPDALLIVLLRDPVRRAYSHYYHEVRMGVESLSFEDAIKAEEERLDQEMEKMVADEFYRSFNYQHYAYLTRGIYVDQIRIWMRYFVRGSILFLDSDELNSDPTKTFRKVTDFLGLRSCEQIDFKKYHASGYPPMNPKTREQLKKYFQRHNQNLNELIGISI